MSTKTPREYMELSIEEMRKSIQEEREDGKVSPQVGAVLVKPNGDFVTAYRGELRDGDHAEYTLLERKCISDNLKGAIVYSTLEPCFKRNPPKVGCCKRLVKARVSKVYVGISDPDPTVNGKGIKYLEDHGVEVEMYPRDLQTIIEKENVAFMKGAEERQVAESDDATDYKTTIERAADNTNLDDLSEELINQFYAKLDLSFSFGSKESTDFLLKMSLVENKNNTIVPTGVGLLLFGNNPQIIYSNAVIKMTQKIGSYETSVDTISGPLIKQPEKMYEWYKDKLSSHIDRTTPKRKKVFDYPLDVIRELVINAIVHRDYDIKGAPVYFEINDDAIIIKSPGQPEPPLKMEQIASFSAPSSLPPPASPSRLPRSSRPNRSRTTKPPPPSPWIAPPLLLPRQPPMTIPPKPKQSPKPPPQPSGQPLTPPARNTLCVPPQPTAPPTAVSKAISIPPPLTTTPSLPKPPPNPPKPNPTPPKLTHLLKPTPAPAVPHGSTPPSSPSSSPSLPLSPSSPSSFSAATISFE